MPAHSPWLTLPNAISLSRLLLAPVAWSFAFEGEAGVYKWLFAVAVLSDLADGLLARLLKAQTVLGSRLDAAADTATYLVAFFAVWHLWPEFIRVHFELLVAALILYTLNYAFSLLRFRRLPAYHSWAGKASAVLMAIGLLAWFVIGVGWIFTAALVISLYSATEQIAITALLPRWATEIPTVLHAWRRRSLVPASHEER